GTAWLTPPPTLQAGAPRCFLLALTSLDLFTVALAGTARGSFPSIARPGCLTHGGTEIFRPARIDRAATRGGVPVGGLFPVGASAGPGSLFQIHSGAFGHAIGSSEGCIAFARERTFGCQDEELAKTLLLRGAKAFGHCRILAVFPGDCIRAQLHGGVAIVPGQGVLVRLTKRSDRFAQRDKLPRMLAVMEQARPFLMKRRGLHH